MAVDLIELLTVWDNEQTRHRKIQIYKICTKKKTIIRTINVVILYLSREYSRLFYFIRIVRK